MPVSIAPRHICAEREPSDFWKSVRDKFKTTRRPSRQMSTGRNVRENCPKTIRKKYLIWIWRGKNGFVVVYQLQYEKLKRRKRDSFYWKRWNSSSLGRLESVQIHARTRSLEKYISRRILALFFTFVDAHARETIYYTLYILGFYVMSFDRVTDVPTTKHLYLSTLYSSIVSGNNFKNCRQTKDVVFRKKKINC